MSNIMMHGITNVSRISFIMNGSTAVGLEQSMNEGDGLFSVVGESKVG